MSALALALLLPGSVPAREQGGQTPGGKTFYRVGEAPPPCTVLGVVYEHRWGPTDKGLPDWPTLQDALAIQARALGADFIVEMETGEEDPLVEKGFSARWLVGLAARARQGAADSADVCENCVVDWLPPAIADDVSPTLFPAGFGDLAFTTSRMRLGERGYYLRRAPLPTPTPADEPPASTLSLQLRAVSMGPANSPNARAGLQARLTWNVSHADGWKRTAPLPRGIPGERNVLLTSTNLFSNLPSRGEIPDTDGDGVLDSRDRQVDTPAGAEVNLFGIARDDDGDGVPNGIDRDPNTPPGVMIDQWGVPIDTDGDGIADWQDKCADTPADLEVDEHGCPVMAWVTRIEAVLLDAGMLREEFHFDLGSAVLQAEARARLDSVGVALSGLRDLRFNVDGHCDDLGTDEFNNRLSEERAQAAINYLVARFPELKREQFTARGFGKSRPIRVGTDEESRARNRRVEFVILNPDDARKQIEVREFRHRGKRATGEPPQPRPPR